MRHIQRRPLSILPALGALALGVTVAACGNAQTTGGETPSANAVSAASYTFAKGEMSIGKADAPVTLVEYASVTCGHCREFHETILPAVKERVEAGEVRFVFREYPTAPANVAYAGFAVARCAGEDKYFEVLDDMFENQMGILQASQSGKAKTALLTVAKRHGLDEASFEACIADPDVIAEINEIVDGGTELGVNATPTLYINDELVGRAGYTLEGLMAEIDAAMPTAQDG